MNAMLRDMYADMLEIRPKLLIKNGKKHISFIMPEDNSPWTEELGQLDYDVLLIQYGLFR